MAEPSRSFHYAVYQLDKDGKRVGFVEGYEEPKQVFAGSKKDAENRVYGLLTKAGKFDPEKAVKEVDVDVSDPFGPTTQ